MWIENKTLGNYVKKHNDKMYFLEFRGETDKVLRFKKEFILEVNDVIIKFLRKLDERLQA